MTRTKKLLLTGGTLALGAAVFAGASLADGWGRHHGGGFHGGGYHGGGYHGGGMGFFEQFDANEDGRLTQAEIDQVRQSRLSEFDQNGDGSLSLEEYQALWMDAMRERMVDRFQAHDDDGDGLVTAEEFGQSFERIIVRFDRDGDGEVTVDEMRRRDDHDHHRGRDGGDRDDG